MVMVPKIYKQVQELNMQKPKMLINKWTNKLKTPFLKEEKTNGQ